MKIAYLDLNYPDHFEDYSNVPTKYGGGRIAAAALLEAHDDFYIMSDPRSFANVRSNKQSQCISLDWPTRKAIREGLPVKDFVFDADQYDVFFHAFTNIHLNLVGCRSPKQAIWSIGWNETINPLNRHVIFFDYYHQNPNMQGSNHKLYHAVIGPKVEPFQQYPKEDLIFQCTRHTACFQSIVVAQLALKYGIQTVFAGPIEENYPLMRFIDGKTTHYIGSIDQSTKIAYNKRAKFHTQFQNYPTCATLSAKEALSYGTPIMAMPIGGWPDFIKQGINGFIITSEREFLQAWENRNYISQRDCYDSMLPYSETKMVETFTEALQKIYENYE